MFLHSTNIYRVPTSVNKLGPEDRYLLNKTDKVPALVELVAQERKTDNEKVHK